MTTPAPMVVWALSQLPTIGGSDLMVGSWMVSGAALRDIVVSEDVADWEGFAR